jgi:hypothetical protein
MTTLEMMDGVAAVEARFPEAEGNAVGFMTVRIAERLRRKRPGGAAGSGIVLVNGQPHALHVSGKREGDLRLTVARRLSPAAVELVMHRPKSARSPAMHSPNHCWGFTLDARAGTMRELDEIGLYHSPQTWPMRPENPREGRRIRSVVSAALLDLLDQRGGNPASPDNHHAMALFAEMTPYNHVSPALEQAVYLAAQGEVAHA